MDASGAAPGYTGRGTDNWHVAQIAFDTDYLFYQANGSSNDATVEDIEFIVNGMAAIYERDADITYTLTTVRVRSARGLIRTRRRRRRARCWTSSGRTG